MKKIICLFALIPLLFTSIAIQFLPSKVPVHFSLNGDADVYTSKFYYMIIPIIIILITLIWFLFILKYEKKARNSSGRECQSALSNAKVFKIIALFSVLSIGVLQCYLLVVMILNKETGLENLNIDLFKISCLLCGIFFIIGGNYIPKTKRNDGIGLRISWSEYSDYTWMKSNYFAGVALMLAGFITIITSAFVESYFLVILTLIYLIIATASSCVYSRKIYLLEIEKEN